MLYQIFDKIVYNFILLQKKLKNG